MISAVEYAEASDVQPNTTDEQLEVAFANFSEHHVRYELRGLNRPDLEEAQTSERLERDLQVYCADEVRRELTREGTVVARCTVERLMRRPGPGGVMRDKVVRITTSDA